MEPNSMEREGRIFQLVVLFHDFTKLLDKRNTGRELRGEDPLRFDPFHGQGRVLRALADRDGITQSELASVLDITPQTLSISLKKLVRDGLVVQEPSTVDRRAKTLHLTEAGTAMKQVLEERAKHSGSMFEAFDDEEAAEFKKLLEKLCSHLEREIEIAEVKDELAAGTSITAGAPQAYCV